ncbi:amidase [Moniliophthora roreri MCA 2997]|uniref:Amidase n=1 Tax=Moniliophthora roreri (strain MCA 2997) TaxID=1381753 RepID=V2X581_MONRO|nr:amidase [Moniliophthora roreri MCA 2997]
MSVVSLKISPDNPIRKDDLDAVLAKLGQELKPEEEGDYLTLLQAIHDSAQVVLNLPEYHPTTDLVRFPRTDIHFPDSSENTHGGWGWKFTARDKDENHGILSGKTIVYKDNIIVAGVGCLLGTDVFTDWNPDVDATVVTRSLEAGAMAIGKAVCENISLSASSFSPATGPVHNPYAKGYSTAGSSSGCGVLVALGEADLAIGGDQGGSIRLPGEWCGLYGFKPTFGLVPYTGIASLEPSIDHAGPMTRTCLDNAILLKAIAGRDEFDDRTYGAPLPKDVPDYPAILDSVRAKSRPLDGLRVGLLKEGFEICTKGGANDPRVGEKVKEAAKKFEDLGATVEEVSIPMHTIAPSLWAAVARMGAIRGLLGGTAGRIGYYMNDLAMKMRNIQTEEGWNKLPWTPKNTILNGTYLWSAHPELYGKAMNQIHHLRAKYDEALAQFDVLALPTTPFLPNRHAPPSTGVLEKISKSVGQTLNTCPFNLSGHPALSMPIGMLSSLDDSSIRFPVSMQIVGKHLDESTIYKAAFSWEGRYNWKEL